MGFLDSGFFDKILPKPAFGSEKLDWISDDETQKRFSTANNLVQSIVTEEERRHKDHADNTAKPFRVDVIRDPRTLITYLDMTCEACGAYKKIRVNEMSGSAEDALKEIAKIEQERRVEERRLQEARAERDRLARERARFREFKKRQEFSYSSMRSIAAYSTAEYDGGSLNPIPLQRKEPKKPVHIDKFRVERAAPAGEDEI
jgi:hypothetical protein